MVLLKWKKNTLNAIYKFATLMQKSKWNKNKLFMTSILTLKK